MTQLIHARQTRLTQQSASAAKPLSVAGGQSLPLQNRKSLEQRFSYDFSPVRIHSDDAASASADAVNALAYTYGFDIVLGSTARALSERQQDHLLDHELRHVIGQTRNGRTNYRLERQAKDAPISPQHIATQGASNSNDIADDIPGVAAERTISRTNLPVATTDWGWLVPSIEVSYEAKGVLSKNPLLISPSGVEIELDKFLFSLDYDLVSGGAKFSSPLLGDPLSTISVAVRPPDTTELSTSRRHVRFKSGTTDVEGSLVIKFVVRKIHRPPQGLELRPSPRHVPKAVPWWVWAAAGGAVLAEVIATWWPVLLLL